MPVPRANLVRLVCRLGVYRRLRDDIASPRSNVEVNSGCRCYTEKAPNAWQRRGTQKTRNTYNQPDRPNQQTAQTKHQAPPKGQPGRRITPNNTAAVHAAAQQQPTISTNTRRSRVSCGRPGWRSGMPQRALRTSYGAWQRRAAPGACPRAEDRWPGEGGGGRNPSALRTQGPERAAIAGPGARKAPVPTHDLFTNLCSVHMHLAMTHTILVVLCQAWCPWWQARACNCKCVSGAPHHEMHPPLTYAFKVAPGTTVQNLGSVVHVWGR